MAQRHLLRPSIAVMLASVFLTTAAFAQTPQPRQSAAQTPSKSQAASPVTMTECEGVNNCARWTFLGVQGTGQWPSGEVANLTVERYDDNSAVIRRADSTGSSAGLTAVYTGTRHGDRVGGEFTSSWPGHWENKSGNWYATVEKPQSPPLAMRVCDLAGNCVTWTWNNGHYDGNWDRFGVTAILTVESFTPESVVIKRVDSAPGPATLTFTGERFRARAIASWTEPGKANPEAVRPAPLVASQPPGERRLEITPCPNHLLRW